MAEMSFTDFEVKEGRIYFAYQELDGEKGTIYFELTPAIRPNNNLIALAISTLCGRTYKRIYIDLDISENVVSEISYFTNATVVPRSYKANDPRDRGNNIILNFSGGFDSLSAKYIMPDKITKLVSMDFGGRFSRERPFFERFNPCIVKTNLVETSLRKNSWSFMGIGSILFSEYLDARFYTFGGILEAGVQNIKKNTPIAQNISFPAFESSGLKNAPYTLGLTEIGTLIVLSHYAPELIGDSLNSLANPGEEKRYRKQVLSDIVSDLVGKKFDILSIEPPKKPHFKFGQNFTADFLSFYIIKHRGIEIASKTISDIPDEVVELSKRLTLKFYERFNTNFLVNFPIELLPELFTKLTECGIQLYTENDWYEFDYVRKVLMRYYNIN